MSGWGVSSDWWKPWCQTPNLHAPAQPIRLNIDKCIKAVSSAQGWSTFPDVGLPGVWYRNIFSSNNPNDSQIACLSLVKNLLMMRIKGAPCLLVRDVSLVYKGKAQGKNNHVSIVSFVLVKTDNSQTSKQTSLLSPASLSSCFSDPLSQHSLQ